MTSAAVTVAVVIGICYFVYTNLNKRNTTRKSEKRTDVTDRKKSSGIVYFTEADEFCKTIVTTIKSKVPEITEIRIRDVKDLKDVLSLCFLIVEFSERDNIVETERDLGTGTLKRQTIQILNDRNVQVVVVYVRDNRSMKLPDGRLYCGDLDEKVKELSNLIKEGHFLAFTTASQMVKYLI